MGIGLTQKEYRRRKAVLKNRIAPLAAKERRKTITAAEAKALKRCREQLGRLNGQVTRERKMPRSATGGGPTLKQGPVRITSVVSGGAPGLGKRK